MATIDELAGVGPEQIADKLGDDIAQDPETEVVHGGGFKLPDWLFIPRLQDPISEYTDHPLNFGKSEGFAYVLRGLSALAGGILNYWWVDVLGGVMRMRRERVTAVDRLGQRATQGDSRDDGHR